MFRQIPIILSLVFILSFPHIAQAAYQNPTVISNDPIANGFFRLGLLFSGNAGEPDVRKEFIVNETTTAVSFRNWVDETIKQLDNLRTAATLPALQVGQTVPRLARVAPVPTAKQIWRSKLSRYLEVKDAGITAAATELAAMKDDLETTYQAGFLE